MNALSELLTDRRGRGRSGRRQQEGVVPAHRRFRRAPRRPAAKAILASLNAREKLGSTGFGGGAAIPHGKLEGLDRVVGHFARLSTPIDFGAVDGMPVDLVFLLLSPPDAGAEHLKALASVSRAFRDRRRSPNCAAPVRATRFMPCSPAKNRAMPPEAGERAAFRSARLALPRRLDQRLVPLRDRNPRGRRRAHPLRDRRRSISTPPARRMAPSISR